MMSFNILAVQIISLLYFLHYAYSYPTEPVKPSFSFKETRDLYNKFKSSEKPMEVAVLTRTFLPKDEINKIQDIQPPYLIVRQCKGFGVCRIKGVWTATDSHQQIFEVLLRRTNNENYEPLSIPVTVDNECGCLTKEYDEPK